MSDLDALLDQLLGKHLEHAGEDIDGSVWRALDETGLTRVGINESLGGSGGDRHDAATITIRAAEAGVRVPLTESLFLVAHLAARTTTSVPSGIVTAVALGPGGCTTVDGGFHIAASCSEVPWGSACDELWLLAASDDGQAVFTRLTQGQWKATAARNLAGEPRDEVVIDAFVEGDQARVLPAGALDDLMLAGALGRSCQLLGALRSALALSHDYALVRHQFTKPLAAHQVVRHQLAGMACEVAAAEAAVSHAVQHLHAAGSELDTNAALGIAAAKVQTSRSATRVARTAHQLHGAVGITAEHPLHHFTTRLWSWRDEFGSDDHWSAHISELVHTAYHSDLWAALTA